MALQCHGSQFASDLLYHYRYRCPNSQYLLDLVAILANEVFSLHHQMVVRSLVSSSYHPQVCSSGQVLS